MYMIEQVTGHTFEYDKIHKALNIVADLPETGLHPAGPGGAAGTADADAPESGAAAGASPSPRAPPRSLHAMAVLPRLSIGFLAPYLGCAETFRTDNRRRGRLGGRTLGL